MRKAAASHTTSPPPTALADADASRHASHSPRVVAFITPRTMHVGASLKAALVAPARSGTFKLSRIRCASSFPEEFIRHFSTLEQAGSPSLSHDAAVAPDSTTATADISAGVPKPHNPGKSPCPHVLGDETPIQSVSMASQQQEVVIALGSNMGNRIASFDKALSMMRKAGIDIICHSSLYESAPAYVVDQPKFLNSAVRARTRLDPSALLGVLKGIERTLGRAASGIRYGPRPIDLDILFYGDVSVSDENLSLPHPRLLERPFVLAPLMDLYSMKLANGNQFWKKRFELAKCAWQDMGGDSRLGQDGLKRVFPIGDKLWDWCDRTYIMGIVNITPDSFSDGGKYFSVQDAVSQAEALAHAGADIIDLGAQSTRPFATKLTADEELARLLPVLEAIKKLPSMDSIWLSVDSFYSKVAREAVKHGVHMVNDVSGGLLDPDMYGTVAELGVPYVLMHMRGDPITMQQEKHLQYKDVSRDVATELCERLREAEASGIPAWRMVVDPGVGFSKTSEQDLRLLRDLCVFRSSLGAWSLTATKLPMLIGPSRKRFLGKICNREKAEDRDGATIGAVVAGVAQGADLVRLHNVKGSIDAIRVADAIFKPTGLSRGLQGEDSHQGVG